MESLMVSLVPKWELERYVVPIPRSCAEVSNAQRVLVDSISKSISILSPMHFRWSTWSFFLS